MLTTENSNSKIEKFLPKDGPSTEEVKKYINKYSKEKIVIKCGGRVLLDPALLDSFINDIAVLKKLGLTPLLVHGGGLGIKKKSDELNIKNKFIQGLRVTDNKMIKIVEEVMIKFNKEIVQALEKKNCKAESVTIRENNVILVEQESRKLGYVGRPKKILNNKIENILDKGCIPIITPMGLDFKGQAYNINADIAAGALARSLRSRRLLLVTDVEGVFDKNNQMITEINTFDAKKMVEDKTIHGGMIPKIETCIHSINNGVRGVALIDGRKPHSVLFELFSDKGAGTLIRK
tara:strand:+ start:404 stop:1276 length:873 start_codon:yes stop_codon:yes gene_type:complete